MVPQRDGSGDREHSSYSSYSSRHLMLVDPCPGWELAGKGSRGEPNVERCCLLRRPRPLHCSPRRRTSSKAALVALVASVLLACKMLPSLASVATFAFFSPLVATVGFSPLYSPAAQCAPFTVTWPGSNVTTGPPFELLILPFDAPPAIFKLPDSSYDATTKTGRYTLDKLPMKSGAQFVVSMDDGYGTPCPSPPGVSHSSRNSSPSFSPNRSSYWRCILGPDRS